MSPPPPAPVSPRSSLVLGCPTRLVTMPPTTPAPSSTTDPSTPPPPAPAPRSRRAHFDLQLTQLDGDSRPSTRDSSPEPVHTPTLSESYSHVRKNLSFKSLRELELRQVQESVWRKGGRGEPGEHKHRPQHMDQVFAHAVRGAARKCSLCPLQPITACRPPPAGALLLPRAGGVWLLNLGEVAAEPARLAAQARLSSLEQSGQA